MARKTKRKSKRLPKVKIPLPFEKAVEGILAISPEDAKDVREKIAKRKK
jgi:hypothetical protein